MKKGESSLTALISAFGRAYHSQFDSPKIFNDYIAKDLISQKEFNDIKENMVQGIHFFNKDIAQKCKENTEEILKWITQVQLSPTPLARSAYCEKVLLHEVTLGLKQYVILGAGLDTFSFRHPELEDSLEIFEIDHPVTQEFKKKRLDQSNLKIPNNLHFVSMDFTKKFSYQELINEGFDNKKTFFSLLGVTYYLTKEEISDLIAHLFTKVPSGSSIVFDYADENLFKEKGISNRVENMVKMASASGEPMKSCFSYFEMEKILEESGLLIYEHLSPTKMNELYFENRDDYLSAFETIHYLHAIKK
ncbi:class I SAM-dependent methyltransferase [Brevibacillus laterosporus]|uniref:S-adenosyl-L-methionine-dependent methyltransferase n=1 Tax=Brevibacillus halotolerans TaxID=1507437 RepID=A0ABT4HYZ5_9BACL|nr:MULTISPECIES: class I SAM-dependent methyltransferase [Brevibacillus]MCR8986294.1 class I SAM-dependent methyltransferase [Brevibacillus laterosporus]MCZ0832028.1 class I SAM-dependent methyltransferase [Brevibacillus halotolerans]